MTKKKSIAISQAKLKKAKKRSHDNGISNYNEAMNNKKKKRKQRRKRVLFPELVETMVKFGLDPDYKYVITIRSLYNNNE